MPVDQDLRFVWLRSGENDARVRLAAHVLDVEVRHLLQDVVDLRIRQIRYRLGRHVGLGGSSGIDGTAARDGHASDRAQRAEVGARQRDGQRERLTGEDRDVVEHRRNEAAFGGFDPIDSLRETQREHARGIAEDRGANWSRSADLHAGHRDAVRRANDPLHHGGVRGGRVGARRRREKAQNQAEHQHASEHVGSLLLRDWRANGFLGATHPRAAFPFLRMIGLSSGVTRVRRTVAPETPAAAAAN